MGRAPKGWGWGWDKEIFSVIGGGENGVKQNHARWRRRSHPSNTLCPAPLPSLVWNNIQQLQEKQKWKEIIHVSRKLVFIVINIIIIIFFGFSDWHCVMRMQRIIQTNSCWHRRSFRIGLGLKSVLYKDV